MHNTIFSKISIVWSKIKPHYHLIDALYVVFKYCEFIYLYNIYITSTLHKFNISRPKIINAKNTLFLLRGQTILDTTEIWLNCFYKTCLLLSLELTANSPPRGCRWFDLVWLMFIYDQHNNSTCVRSTFLYSLLVLSHEFDQGWKNTFYFASVLAHRIMVEYSTVKRLRSSRLTANLNVTRADSTIST